MNINGFEIEKYNQYNLPENVNKSVCPLCSESRKPENQKVKVLMLDWKRGLGTCQHCGEVLQLHTYKKTESKKEYFRPEYKNNTKLSDKLVQWFEGRGISQFVLRQMKISEGMEWMPQLNREANTIQFNYFRNGELINIKYRDARKNFKLVKDAEKIFYNLDNCAISNDIVIVEGEIDALSYIEAGIYHVVSVPNGSVLKGQPNLDYLDNCIEYFENKQKVYLALDNDDAGKNTLKEFIRRIGSERCFLIDFNDCKDANEYLCKHGRDSLKNTIENAKEIPIEGVSSVNDWKSEFESYLVNGMQKGFVTGINGFDYNFSTYTGQYIVVTGKPSSGKSDFVDQMILGYNKQYGWKTAFASPENKPNKIHAGKLISKICGAWINKQEQINTDWFKLATGIINDNIKFIDLDGSFDLESVLNITRSLIFKYGIKCLVIDPYNKVRLKESANKNINEYTADYLLKIDEFARKHDILIFLIAHPRKPSVGETQTYEPSFYDIKGGGEFYDMSPHGLLVHRDYENELVKVKVLKVKFSHLGENNAHCYLKWNKLNGRYSDFRVQHENPLSCIGLVEDNSNWVCAENASQIKIEYEKPIDNTEGLNYNFESSETAPF